MNKRRIVVLGSTGSIGESAFRVLSHGHERFEVIGLAARSRIDRLAEQAKTLHEIQYLMSIYSLKHAVNQ